MLKSCVEGTSIKITEIKNDNVSFATTNASDKNQGIFWLKPDCGRGLDFKCGCNAKVLIIITGSTTLTTQDVYQMAGRGNRQQGRPEATCYLYKFNAALNGGAALLHTNSLKDGMDSAKLADNFHRQFASLKNASIKQKVC